MERKIYIERLQAGMERLHHCGATWFESVPVQEFFRGEPAWTGVVEVFTLQGHPRARKAYGWSHPDGNDHEAESFMTVLELPPVDSAQMAVRMAMAAEGGGKR
jgi:hypothetical protein